MKLSRTVAYAIQATLQLAELDSNTPVPCSKLAAQGGMPERFLLQVLRSLVTHGILQSTRGVEGGYSLVKPPEEISVLELIEAIDGPMASNLAAADGLSEVSQSKLHSALEEVTTTAREQLQALKISQILPVPKPVAPVNDFPSAN
ncbi:MAG: Rrf2 family transcriptional regulator [Pirellulaceae bacterium]